MIKEMQYSAYMTNLRLYIYTKERQSCSLTLLEN